MCYLIVWYQASSHHSPSNVLSGSVTIQATPGNLVKHTKLSHHIVTQPDQSSLDLQHLFCECISRTRSSQAKPVKHRAPYTPAPRWGACGLQHQCGARRSMLSFMDSSVSSLSVVLGIVPRLIPASATTILLSPPRSTFQVFCVVHANVIWSTALLFRFEMS